MHRRTFLCAVAGGLVVAPLAGAQQGGRTWRVGYLSSTSSDVDKAWVAAFRNELRRLGYVEGRSVVLEVRHSEGRTERLPELAADLVRRNVDVIVTWGGAPAARSASRTTPIVLAVHADPVGAGLVASLDRPGGNVTGLSDFHAGSVAKRVELLRAVVPSSDRVAALLNPDNPTASPQLASARAAAAALGMTVVAAEARGDGELERAFSAIAKERPGALLIIPDPAFTARKRIADLCVANRLPAISTVRQWAEVGILMAYGTNYADLWRRAAGYVDRILRGANPADLPVEQPTKFEFVVNLRTAQALGLVIPQSVLLRADEVIG